MTDARRGGAALRWRMARLATSGGSRGGWRLPGHHDRLPVGRIHRLRRLERPAVRSELGVIHQDRQRQPRSQLRVEMPHRIHHGIHTVR